MEPSIFDPENHWIAALRVNGVLVTRQAALARAIPDYFKHLYDEPSIDRPFPTTISFKKISGSVAEQIVTPFTMDEIEKVVMNRAGDKTPGKDGFPMLFYRGFWDIVKHDVVAALLEFQEQGFLLRPMTKTLLCLIPDKNKDGDEVGDVKDLRVFSLVNSVYKILSKALMARLRECMANVVSEQQYAFVGRRKGLDASRIANEVIESRRRSGKPGLVFKVELDRGYDHINWNCLFTVLDRMEFPRKWISWIRTCITTVHLGVLINGQKTGYFKSSRGLRQGDPLSPFLFVIVMEVLSRILEAAREDGQFCGFFMNQEDKEREVTHILHADKTLLFCDAEEDQVRNLLAAFVCFENITGLKVDLRKSSVFAVRGVTDPQTFADTFGCKVEKLPTIYLGLPLGISVD